MVAREAEVITSASNREIVLTRVFDAPRSMVWDAWTDPAQAAQWWGPRGFTVTTHEVDVRAGGVWRFTMHGPDGTDYPNEHHYTEVVPQERITHQHGGHRPGGTEVSFVMTVTFEDEGDGTRVTLRQVHPSMEVRDQLIREHGVVEGGKQHLQKLADYLDTLHKEAANG
jgi:uncharacterized protein YndB with AHSA1/START domain